MRIYSCADNSDNPDANYLFVTAGTRADKDRPAAETLCGSKNKNANFLKMDPTIHKPLADVATADNACVYDDPVGAGIITADTGNKKIANNMILGCVPADCDPPFDPSSCENCKMTDGTGGAKRVDDSVLSRDDAIIVRNYVATLESLNLGDDVRKLSAANAPIRLPIYPINNPACCWRAPHHIAPCRHRDWGLGGGAGTSVP